MTNYSLVIISIIFYHSKEKEEFQRLTQCLIKNAYPYFLSFARLHFLNYRFSLNLIFGASIFLMKTYKYNTLIKLINYKCSKRLRMLCMAHYFYYYYVSNIFVANLKCQFKIFLLTMHSIGKRARKFTVSETLLENN